MKIIKTAIPDVCILEPHVFGDTRGFFMETWNAQVFSEAGLDLKFVQDNHSHSQHGTLRGLHYQLKQPQGKLVRVSQGRVFDVAVDIRQSSATFGQWVGIELSADNHRMLWIPPGFAHGFYVISATAGFQYKCTNFYAPEYERCIIWNDAELSIKWPLKKEAVPLVSNKDSQGLTLQKAELFP